MIFNEVAACPRVQGALGIMRREMPRKHHAQQIRILLMQYKHQADTTPSRQRNIYQNEVDIQIRDLLKRLFCRGGHGNNVEMPSLTQHTQEGLRKDGMVFYKKNRSHN